MTSRSRRVCAWAVVSTVALLTACTWSRQDEALLARNLRVGGATSTQVTPATPIRIWRPDSELWLEIPTLGPVSTTTSLNTGEPLRLDLAAELRDGTRLQLDRVSTRERENRHFAVATCAQLLGRTRDQPSLEVVTFWIKSPLPVHIDRVMWLSYDPRDFKSGVSSPLDAMEQ